MATKRGSLVTRRHPYVACRLGSLRALRGRRQRRLPRFSEFRAQGYAVGTRVAEVIIVQTKSRQKINAGGEIDLTGQVLGP